MTTREWREASDLRSSVMTIGLVLLSATLLRFWASDAGLPFTVEPHEPVVMDPVVQAVKTGALMPQQIGDGGALFYAHTLTAAARFLAGARAGRWTTLAETDTRDFYAWSRRLTALLGVVTILLVYVIGRRWGERHALLAAGLMTVMPPHVRASHYVLVDVPLVFFVTLAALLALRAGERARLADFCWAGFVAGLAASLRLSGSLALLLPLLAAWMTLEASPSRLRCALASLAAAVAGFVLGLPMSVLDPPGFLNAVAALAAPAGTVPTAFGWMLGLAYLRDSMGWPALTLALVGLVMGAVRAIKGPGRLRWTIAVVVPVLFLQLFASSSGSEPRSILPALPFTCLLAASAVVSGVSLLRRFDIPRTPRTALIAGLTVAALVLPSIRAIDVDRRLGQRTTLEQAYDWIMREVPPGASIAVGARDLWLPPDRYTVVRLEARADHAEPTRGGQTSRYRLCTDAGDAAANPGDCGSVAGMTQIAVFEPSRDHPGPELHLFIQSTTSSTRR